MNSMMPPLYRNVWLRVSRSSSMTIFSPRFRNASSRRRLLSVSKEKVVSSKILVSGLNRMIVPVFLVVPVGDSGPAGTPRS